MIYEVIFENRFISNAKVNRDSNVVSVDFAKGYPLRYNEYIENFGFCFYDIFQSGETDNHKFIIDMEFGENTITSRMDVYQFIYNKVLQILRHRIISKLVDE